MHTIISGSTKWKKNETVYVFNEVLKKYRDSLLEPKDINHQKMLDEAQQLVLPRHKWKSSGYLATRSKLRKKLFLEALVKEAKKEQAGKKPKTSNSISNSISNLLVDVDLQSIIQQQVNTKFDEIFTSDFKAQVRQAVLTSVTSPQNITGYISGTFNGTFTPEKPKIQPLAPVPPVQALASTVDKAEPEYKVIIDSSVQEPVEKNKECETLYVAVAGFSERYHEEIKKAANHIHRMINIRFFASPLNRQVTIPRLAANFDYVFIVKSKGIGPAEEARLLANGYHHRGNFEITSSSINPKELGKKIADWSIEERRKNEGILQ